MKYDKSDVEWHIGLEGIHLNAAWDYVWKREGRFKFDSEAPNLLVEYPPHNEWFQYHACYYQPFKFYSEAPPPYLNEMFQINFQLDNYNTKNNTSLHVPRYNLVTG